MTTNRVFQSVRARAPCFDPMTLQLFGRAAIVFFFFCLWGLDYQAESFAKRSLVTFTAPVGIKRSPRKAISEIKSRRIPAVQLRGGVQCGSVSWLRAAELTGIDHNLLLKSRIVCHHCQ